MNRPNVMVITTHDSGIHFGCYGAKGVRTQAIDRLAQEGYQFTSMFSTCTICSPSRGSLLTGMWPGHNGLLGLSGGAYRYVLDDTSDHLSDILRRNGYETRLYGHQHEAIESDDLSFDSIFPLAIDGERRSAVDVAREVADGLDAMRDADSPWYFQVGFHETHTPYLWGGLEADRSRGTPVPSYTRYPDNDFALNDHIAGLQASVGRVDDAVGVITDALRETGHEANTILLFTTDHGPELPRAKWSGFDPGARIAFVLRWPDHIPAVGRCDSMRSNVDFLPTLLELVGIEIPTRVDGESYAGSLDGGKDPRDRDELFFSFAYGSTWAIRTRTHKFIRCFEERMHNGERFHEGMVVPRVLLFDLQSDPLEFENVADIPAYSEIRNRLDDALWSYLERTECPILEGPIEHPVARGIRQSYAQHQGTWDGIASGRSSVSGSRPFEVRNGSMLLRVDLQAIHQEKAIGLYDAASDPACECNLADEPDHAGSRDEMFAALWAHLEATDDPVRFRDPTSSALERNLSEYQRWRDGRAHYLER